ncbi:hydroxymethylglutaryl-CoA reductase [candidate division KSB1 bacterium]|nr:hydroxymethylglutaryl-CoA reductase [candidate division KSB1 bacterium]RQW11091.1 MAG: hydroxymethylglutaryl-CoA reductase [candidate division KSB1 bacterium]
MIDKSSTAFATIPMQLIGPIKIIGPVVDDEVRVPIATFESPLWLSTDRGAAVSMRSGGIQAIIIDERMSRSVLVEAPDARCAAQAMNKLLARKQELGRIAQSTSRYAEFLDIHWQLIANLLFIRLEMKTGDASGHNMVTKAADAILRWILNEHPELSYVSVSGNYCADKKVAAVNGILGRGKNVIAEMTVPNKICRRYLKTAPRHIVDLNVKKNLYGSIVAGGLRTANAHFANMLLGFYLATGQDAANIIEGSQGFVNAEVRDHDLYFAVTLPNLILGTVGAGKDLEFVQENLRALGCAQERQPGENARRLAVIAAATVLCGELSLLAALTNPGELMAAHERLER